MARKQKLKVYRTPIGFHDAYVAAISQKAALKAWGSDVDLFARGVAEQVLDEALGADALARPGDVIRRSRGTRDEQLAALPPDRAKKPAPSSMNSDQDAEERESHRPRQSGRTKQKPAPKARSGKPKPRPSREKLDRAEERLAALEAEQRAQEEAQRQREREIARERRDLARRHERERKVAQADVERERDNHSAALGKWRDQQA